MFQQWVLLYPLLVANKQTCHSEDNRNRKNGRKPLWHTLLYHEVKEPEMSEHVFTTTPISRNRATNTISSIFSKNTNRHILLVTHDWVDVPPSMLIYGRFVFCHGRMPSYQIFTIGSNRPSVVTGVLPLTAESLLATLRIASMCTECYEVPNTYRTKFIESFNSSGAE